jgi:hypothetical protein
MLRHWPNEWFTEVAVSCTGTVTAGTHAVLRSCLSSRQETRRQCTEQPTGSSCRRGPHLKMAICSAKVALCLRRVCFMRVSARVLVGLSLGLSAGEARWGWGRRQVGMGAQVGKAANPFKAKQRQKE